MPKAKVTPPEGDVAEAFAAFPPAARKRLLALRRIIFEAAAERAGVGPLTETLKWGEPAYLTEASKSGSTIRLGWKAKAPDQYAMYVNCQTDLVDRFRDQFSDVLRFEGNRAIVLDVDKPLPTEALILCVAAALTYHRDKRALRRA